MKSMWMAVVLAVGALSFVMHRTVGLGAARILNESDAHTRTTAPSP